VERVGIFNRRKKVRQGKHITTLVATAGLCLAFALPFPCLAQRGRFRPYVAARAQAPVHSAPARNGPGPSAVPHAQNPARPVPRGHSGYWLRQHKDMTPAEQERALQNDPNFRRLNPQQQQRLRQRLQHFSSLPPQQQQRMLNRMETWEHLTPAQKQQVRQFHYQLQMLPPGRQRMVGTALNDLRAMPPAQREQVIDSERFRSMFSPQEREMLRGASRLPLTPPEERAPQP
jgi:hypothetical protein